MIITILGGGSWGTALAVHLAKKNHLVKVWEFVEQQAEEMQEQRVCKLLPEVKLPENIFISSRMKEVFPSDLVLLVVPSEHAEKTVQQAKSYLNRQPIIICSKGFAQETRLLTEAISEIIPNQLFCLYGPTHAEEVGKSLFSGIVLAGGEGKERIKAELESSDLKIDLSDDLVGVQVAAALKNILAIFIGILDGLKLGDNAKAYFIVKGLEEIRHIGLAWGGKEETFHGLAGIGDIIVTCMSRHSRNRYVGEQLGKGRKLAEILAEMSMVAEGVNTIKSAMILKERFKLELPMITGLHQVLFENRDVRKLVGHNSKSE